MEGLMSPKEQRRQADRNYMDMLIKQARAKWERMPQYLKDGYVRQMEEEDAR
jgi:hypothetical protein